MRKHEDAPSPVLAEQGFQPLALLRLAGEARIDDHAVDNHEQAVLVLERIVLRLKLPFVFGDHAVVDGTL